MPVTTISPVNQLLHLLEAICYWYEYNDLDPMVKKEMISWYNGSVDLAASIKLKRTTLHSLMNAAMTTKKPGTNSMTELEKLGEQLKWLISRK
jgi:hypothetical protein